MPRKHHPRRREAGVCTPGLALCAGGLRSRMDLLRQLQGSGTSRLQERADRLRQPGSRLPQLRLSVRSQEHLHESAGPRRRVYGRGSVRLRLLGRPSVWLRSACNRRGRERCVLCGIRPTLRRSRAGGRSIELPCERDDTGRTRMRRPGGGGGMVPATTASVNLRLLRRALAPRVAAQRS